MKIFIKYQAKFESRLRSSLRNIAVGLLKCPAFLKWVKDQDINTSNLSIPIDLWQEHQIVGRTNGKKAPSQTHGLMDD